jgi:integrase
MRTAKPWYRESKDAWYVEIDGKQVRLAKGKKNKKEAEDEFHKKMAQRGRLPAKATQALTVTQLAALFLAWSEKHHDADTTAWYRSYVEDFRDHERIGATKAIDIVPYHLTQWLDSNPAWKSRHHPIACVKRLFAWGVQEGLLKDSPLRSVKKPPTNSRVVVLTTKEREEVLAAIKDEPFRNFVFAMQQTGCRPSEIRRVSAANVNLDSGLWVFEKHKTGGKTHKVRVVYLTPGMLELSKKLVAKHPIGPLFTTMRRVRNEQGELVERGFTKNGIRCRFRELRRKLPHLKKLISYAYRHSFATEALVKGIGAPQVAELLGHESLEMIVKHYSHLGEKLDHMRQMANKAAGE